MKIRSTLRITVLFALLVFLFLPLLCSAQAGGKASLLLKDGSVPTLGSGPVKVRFYTDYFCPPCKAFEPMVEPVIMDLLKRNAITITFIDAPFHKYSSLYVKYFLFIYRERKDQAYVLRGRHLLFEAAQTRTKEGTVTSITDAVALEEYLAKNNVKFQIFDVTPVFDVFKGYLQEDKINQTPMCVIINGDKKETYRGGADIIKGLAAIK